MRVVEQLRFGCTAKRTVSAPRPSSAPFGGTFPEGKVWGAYRPAAVCNDRRGGRLEMNLEQMIRNYDHAEKEKRN